MWTENDNQLSKRAFLKKSRLEFVNLQVSANKRPLSATLLGEEGLEIVNRLPGF